MGQLLDKYMTKSQEPSFNFNNKFYPPRSVEFATFVAMISNLIIHLNTF